MYSVKYALQLIGVGSMYTVWGRKFCPAVNGTTTIYTGNLVSLVLIIEKTKLKLKIQYCSYCKFTNNS